VTRRDLPERVGGPKTLIIAGTNPLPATEAEAAAAVDFTIGRLSRYEDEHPLVCRLSIISPHTPVLPPAPYDTMYDPDSMAFPTDDLEDVDLPNYITDELWNWEGTQRMSDGEIRKARAHYFGLCSYVDAEIGRYLRWLEMNWERPYVVLFHSDHGTLIGEHGLHEKFSMYRPAVQVPLILSGAGLPAGLVIRRYTELVDIAPTLLALSGMLEEYPHPVDGRNLLDLLANPQGPWRAYAYSEMKREGRELKYLTDGKLTFHTRAVWKESPAHDPDGGLFDLEADPYETRNLFNDPKYSEVRAKLSKIAKDWDSAPGDVTYLADAR